METALVITGALGIAGTAAAFFAPTWVDNRIEQRRDARELRAARRLVADELNFIVAQLRVLIQGKKTSGAAQVTLQALPSGEWETWKATLARSETLSFEDWRRLAIVYTRLPILRRLFDGRTITDTDVGHLQDTKAKAEYVRDMLIEAQAQEAGLKVEVDPEAWDVKPQLGAPESGEETSAGPK